MRDPRRSKRWRTYGQDSVGKNRQLSRPRAGMSSTLPGRLQRCRQQVLVGWKTKRGRVRQTRHLPPSPRRYDHRSLGAGIPRDVHCVRWTTRIRRTGSKDLRRGHGDVLGNLSSQRTETAVEGEDVLEQPRHAPVPSARTTPSRSTHTLRSGRIQAPAGVGSNGDVLPERFIPGSVWRLEWFPVPRSTGSTTIAVASRDKGSSESGSGKGLVREPSDVGQVPNLGVRAAKLPLWILRAAAVQGMVFHSTRRPEKRELRSRSPKGSVPDLQRAGSVAQASADADLELISAARRSSRRLLVVLHGLGIPCQDGAGFPRRCAWMILTTFSSMRRTTTTGAIRGTI